MIKNIFILFFVILSAKAISQDLIVTQAGDSLRCEILKIKKEFIQYQLQTVTDSSIQVIPMKEVFRYFLKYYGADGKPLDFDGPENRPEMRLAVNLGYSHRLGKIDEGQGVPIEHLRKLKQGFHVGADFSVYFNKGKGVGLKLNHFLSSNSMQSVGNISDNITITYLGPMYSSRYVNERSANALIFQIGLGHFRYKNSTNYFGVGNEIKGSTVGGSVDLGYDFKVGIDVFLGFQVSAMIGVLGKVKVDNGTYTESVNLKGDNREGLSKIDLSIGLRF